MSDDNFDEIVSNMGDETPDPEKMKFKDPSDLLEFYWRKFYPDTMYVKSIMVAEAIDKDGKPMLMWDTSETATQWDVLGLLEILKQQLATRDVVRGLAQEIFEGDDDDDGDDD